MDAWDELQQAIGKGWPHYKELAQPLIAHKQISGEIINNDECGHHLYNNQRHADWMCFIIAVILLQYCRQRAK